MRLLKALRIRVRGNDGKHQPANLEPYSPSGFIMSVGMSTSAPHALTHPNTALRSDGSMSQWHRH